MRVQISAIHFKASEDLKTFAENEVQRLLRFSDDILNCEIEFSYNKAEKRSNITLKLGGAVLNASEASEEFKKSTVLAVDKLEKQLKKFKGKLQEKHS
ncbi:ribosome-associated translation inhibitor RaiA [bacterium]|nr:ribosome-associated translation inhibitor RaiA [bacterium]MBU1638268.1 ribosome-associated translation inhibitor RaiA [bacterium]MBU1919590.1 ribosome-associated translation inhibitor RaiA [bacterium]